MAKETDTVRTKADDEGVPTPEEKAFDIRKYIVGGSSDESSSKRERSDDDVKETKRRRKAEELEDRAHQANLDAQAAEFAPIIFAVGSQATDRITPESPYKYDEALSLSKALVNFTDKYSDSFIGEWKEEIALVMVAATQIVPRYIMWRGKQPIDLAKVTHNPSVETVQNGQR